MGISFHVFGDAFGKNSKTRTKTALACDSLEGRRLLTSLPVVPLSTPPIAAVASATSILQQKAPASFAKYEADLEKVEASSHISVAYENAISLNEAQLENAIESAGFSTAQATNDINHIQDVIDASFTGTVNKKGLEADIQGSSATPQLVKLTISNMDSIARLSGVSIKLHATLSADSKAITSALGPNPDTNLGAGAIDRDPLVVYYNAQASKFVH
jgi:hypothetical protein